MSIILFENIESGKIHKFALKDFMLIGRSEDNDVILNHKKISSQHAKIVKDDKSYYLIDLGSRNGIKINGNKAKNIKLDNLNEVIIGSFKIKIMTENEVSEQKKSKEKKYFEEFEDLFQKTIKKSKNDPQNLVSLTPALKLNVISGLNAGQCFLLGYGPRLFGPLSLETMILDEEKPGFEFIIFNFKNKNYIQPLSKNILLFNSNYVNHKQTIKNGDIYQFGKTRFEIIEIEDINDFKEDQLF
jgi:pSer/pThr/pTyr-binding forkhead associated (FHA) protein